MPWTISPIENTTDLEVGDVFQITLEGGQTKMGVISDITALPDGTGWTLTLWADPGPEADNVCGVAGRTNICATRSRYAGKPLPHLWTSTKSVNRGPKIPMCSWCGRLGDPT